MLQCFALYVFIFKLCAHIKICKLYILLIFGIVVRTSSKKPLTYGKISKIDIQDYLKSIFNQPAIIHNGFVICLYIKCIMFIYISKIYVFHVIALATER